MYVFSFSLAFSISLALPFPSRFSRLVAILDVEIGPTFSPSTAVILPCSMFTVEKQIKLCSLISKINVFAFLLSGMQSVKSK